LYPKPRNRFAAIVKRKFLGFVRGQVILTVFLTISTFLVLWFYKYLFPLAAIVGFGYNSWDWSHFRISTISLIVLSQSVWLALSFGSAH